MVRSFLLCLACLLAIGCSGDKTKNSEPKLSREKLGKINIGDTEAEVKAALGAPFDEHAEQIPAKPELKRYVLTFQERIPGGEKEKGEGERGKVIRITVTLEQKEKGGPPLVTERKYEEIREDGKSSKSG